MECVTAKQLLVNLVVAMPTSSRIQILYEIRVPEGSNTFTSKRWRPIFEVQLIGERETRVRKDAWPSSSAV